MKLRPLSLSQVLAYGTLPIMKPGAGYDFADDVRRHLAGGWFFI